MTKEISAKIRKENFAFLKEKGYIVNENLPLLDYSEDFKSENEIANRINVLHILYTIHLEGKKSRKFFYKLIKNEGWKDSLSDWEKAFFNKIIVNKQDMIDISWGKEAIYKMLWATNKIEPEIGFNEIDLSNYYSLIPPEINFSEFSNSLKLRDAYIINKELDLYYNLHWIAKHYESPSDDLNLSLIIEKRKALEWIVDNHVSWDDINLDT